MPDGNSSSVIIVVAVIGQWPRPRRWQTLSRLWDARRWDWIITNYAHGIFGDRFDVAREPDELLDLIIGATRVSKAGS